MTTKPSKPCAKCGGPLGDKTIVVRKQGYHPECSGFDPKRLDKALRAIEGK